MALGFGKKTAAAPNIVSAESTQEKGNNFTDDKAFVDFSGNVNNAENAGQTPAVRKMSRIDRPVTKSIAGDQGTTNDSDTDVSVSVGKQMEMEAGNAIKYRTCSWQKVCLSE